MGETEDKDPPQQTNGPTEPAQTPAEDATETDKLLKDDNKKVELTEAAVTAEVTKEEPKLNGEEIINIPDDKETEKGDGDAKEPKKKINAEEKEVKPKKIPIGGIKIPGFFTRNKDKSKGDGDGAENELLEKGEAEEKPPKEEGEKKPSFLDNLSQRLRNTFARKPVEVVTVATDENNQENNKQNDEKAEGRFFLLRLQ